MFGNKTHTLGILMLGMTMLSTTSPPSQATHLPDDSSSCDRTRFKIALDIGHTPEAQGAVSARGVPEYAFNSSLAKRVALALREGGFEQVYLITASGTGRLQLEQRVASANRLGVDLFLSIHHDDVQPIYYESWNYENRKRHFSDRFSGYSIFVSRRNRFVDRSVLFAQFLGTELVSKRMRFSLHHAEHLRGENREVLDREHGIYRYDNLFVLAQTHTPAVLLEAGIIVNRAEELELVSPERTDAIASAVLTATIQFCIATDPRKNTMRKD